MSIIELLENVGEVWGSCERAGGAHGIFMGGANTCVYLLVSCERAVSELWESCGGSVNRFARSLRSRASLGAGRERAGREREGSLRDRCGRVVGELRTSRIIIGCHWIILHLSFE